MIHYCTRCKINWHKLHEDIDVEREEWYEYCPKCKTASFLTEGTDFVAYIMCPITGRISDPDTGKEWEDPEIVIGVAPRRVKKVVYDETYEEFRERQAKAEDTMIDLYLKLCETMPPGEAALKVKREPVKRKYHYEQVNE